MNDKARFIKKRKHARDKAMQALYQWQLSGEELDEFLVYQMKHPEIQTAIEEERGRMYVERCF